MLARVLVVSECFVDVALSRARSFMPLSGLARLTLTKYDLSRRCISCMDILMSGWGGTRTP